MRISSGTLILLATSIAVLLALAGFALGGGWEVEGAKAAVRLTARWSFIWFLVAWSASSVAALWPGGWRAHLLRRRRAIGLSFAASQFVHAVCFLTAILNFGILVPLPVMIGGGTGYLFTGLMAATSNNAAMRLLGLKAWQALHLTGGWILWSIFAFSYTGRIAGNPWLGIPASALLALSLVLRMAVKIRAARRKSATGL